MLYVRYAFHKDQAYSSETTAPSRQRGWYVRAMIAMVPFKIKNYGLVSQGAWGPRGTD
jgi:hypothetical protein